MAARNFLHETLPFLARVLLQDAPWWMAAYPSSMFQSKMMPAFNVWAHRFVLNGKNSFLVII
jgi:hypothetical protein